MNRFSAPRSVLLLALLTAACASNSSRKQSLFDGETLEGWRASGSDEGWIVEEECIVCTASNGGYLYTEEQFGDFDLEVEWMVVDEQGNSGIFFRWSDLADPVHTGIEMQVLDRIESEEGGVSEKHFAGAIYDIHAPLVNNVKPAGQWNTSRIRCQGPRIECWQNGELTASIDLDEFTEAGKNPDGTPNKFHYAYKELPRVGHIGFQDHGNRVKFRNVVIRRL